MARIYTNVGALSAQRGLAKSQRMLSDTLQRLSSGLRINRGADDPAGLIASEGLRSEMSGISQAINNSQRASNVISTAEANLSEVATLLTNVKELIVEAANSGALSKDEIDANQLQIDSAVASITRISNTATFAGLKLLDGSLDYVTSGVNTGTIAAMHINQANFGTMPFVPVKLDILASAKTAALSYQTSQIATSVTLEINGTEGVTVLRFTSGTTASQIAAAVNGVSDATGVKASYINPLNVNSGINFNSIGYGTKSFVAVRALPGSGTWSTLNAASATATRAVGADALATANGALAVGDGLNLRLNTASLDIELTLDKSIGVGTTSFEITGGGAKFQLGPQVNSNQQISMGIRSVAASQLGDGITGYLSDIVTGGTASLGNGGAGTASLIIEKAIRQVAIIRGRLGAFEKNTLQTSADSLSVALENVTASESSIRDADFAQETSNLTRSQILVSAGTSVLSTANSTPQSVLQLLQR